MKKQQYTLGFLLAILTGVALVTLLLLRTFLPRIILPRLDANLIVFLTLISLVLDHYLFGAGQRDYRFLPIYAFLIFGLFPLAAFLLAPLSCLWYGLLGCAIVCALTFLFDSMVDRLSGTPITKAAPIIGAFGLYLVAQSLMGIV